MYGDNSAISQLNGRA